MTMRRATAPNITQLPFKRTGRPSTAASNSSRVPGFAIGLRQLQSSPNATAVSLKNLDIADIRPLWGRLAMMPKLESLNLSGNRLSALPLDMKVLAKIRHLDLSQNTFPEGLQPILDSLKSLPALRDLCIDFSSEDEKTRILIALPQLKSLNGAEVELHLHDFDEPQVASLQPQQTQIPPPSELGTDESEMQSLPTSAASINGDIPEVTLTKGDLQNLALLFQNIQDMYGSNLSDLQSRRMTATFDNHLQTVVSRLNDRLESIEDSAQRQMEIIMAKHGLYDVCFQEIISFAHSANPQLSAAVRQISGVHAELFESMEAVVSRSVTDRDRLHVDLEKSRQETTELLEAAETLEKEAEQHQVRTAQLEDEIKQLKEAAEKQFKPTTTKSRPSTRTAATIAKKNEDGSTTYSVRNLTIKQLKDYIDQINASKEKYDLKCNESHLPRETMEMHMYTYLNQRYGLSNLIIESAAAIIKAMQKYMHEDNDVAVFTKVFRNEIDEEFRKVQTQIKETVADLLRIHLKSKHRLKSDEVITEHLKRKTTGHLSQDEWKSVVKYMYSEEDSTTLSEVIHDTEGSSPVAYGDFVKVLLDFQLHGHDRFLMRFREIFQSIDIDSDGVLNEEEFRDLVHRVSPTRNDDEIAEQLESLDPNREKRITFSDAVSVMSPDIVDMMISVARNVTQSPPDSP